MLPPDCGEGAVANCLDKRGSTAAELANRVRITRRAPKDIPLSEHGELCAEPIALDCAATPHGMAENDRLGKIPLVALGIRHVLAAEAMAAAVSIDVDGTNTVEFNRGVKGGDREVHIGITLRGGCGTGRATSSLLSGGDWMGAARGERCRVAGRARAQHCTEGA